MTRRPDAPLSQALAPGNNTLGVMLPYTPLHHLLFGDSFSALVMTSGNLSEEPIVTGNREAAARLDSIADAFLFHNRDIHTRVDDSVARVFAGKERVLRRSRGYAPHPVTLNFPVAEILACGAELKNTFCLTKDHHAFLSQHIGDLENYETLVFYRETLDRMKQLFRIAPTAVAYDLHPQYLSTKLALEMTDVQQIGVQHHHAHIASCMAENGIAGQGDRRGIRRNGIRHGRQDLGRRISGRGFRRASSAALIFAIFRWPAATGPFANLGGWP